MCVADFALQPSWGWEILNSVLIVEGVSTLKAEIAVWGDWSSFVPNYFDG